MLSKFQIVGHNIRHLRLVRGKTQGQLAAEAGCSRGTIYAVETARFKSIDSLRLERIADALRTSVGALYKERDYGETRG